MAKTVEEWLNEVNYKDDDKYVPTEFAIQFVNFIKLVNDGMGEENKTPVLHYKMLDALTKGDRSIINMVFRGGAKTSIMGEYLFLYLACYSGELPCCPVPVDVAMYISDSMDNGVNSMRKNLQYRWENSDFLQQYIPHTRFIADRWEFTNLEGYNLIVRGFGAKSGVRGFKEKGKRPVLAVMDDLVSDEDARSPTIISSIEATVHKAIDYALHPTHKVKIWSGTPFNASDPLYKSTESGAWAVNVFPVCEKFPADLENFQGGWEDRFTYESVRKTYDDKMKEGKVQAFNQELMLRIMSDDDRLVTDEEIQWYSLTTLAKHKDNYNYYITTDFATSDKQSADFSFISVWAINNKGFRFWVDGTCARQTMDKNIDDLFRLVQKYNPQSVGVEITGQQQGFISWIQKEMIVRNIFFSLASDKQGNNNSSMNAGIRPTSNKLERFNIIVPDFKLKKFYFPVEKKHTVALKEMITELQQASVSGFQSKHDDAIDTISMLSSMPIWNPSTDDLLKKNSNDIWETSNNDNGEDGGYASYLV